MGWGVLATPLPGAGVGGAAAESQALASGDGEGGTGGQDAQPLLAPGDRSGAASFPLRPY